MQQEFQNNTALTGLRGFAVSVVFIGHLASDGLLPSFLGSGLEKLGVWIFFNLSAYLMCRLYLHRDPGQNMRHYALARVGRVLPLYYLVVLAAIAFAGDTLWRYQFGSERTPLTALLLVSAPYELWAVPVEVQFYALFAFLWIAWSRGLLSSPVRLLGALAGLEAIAVAITLLKYRFGQDFDGLNLYLHYFLLGILAATYEQQITKVLESSKKLIGSAGLLGLVIILYIVSMPVVRAQFGVHIPDRLDPFATLLAFLIFNLALRRMAGFAVFEHKAFVFLGVISYGLYIIHHLVMTYVEQRFAGIQPLVLALGIIAVSLALATISYYAFEKPLANVIRRSGARRMTVEAN